MPRAAVIIGLGGVGKVVLMKMRRLIVEEYGSLSALPHVRFLHVDTYKARGGEPGQNFDIKVLGEDILFDKGTERVELSHNLEGDPIGHPNVKEWYPDNLPVNCKFVEGAGGVRAFGRLAFHYNVHEFRRSLNRTVRDANVDGTDGLDAYIVASLFGGTGSGAFVDVCYNVREELRLMQRNNKILGFFIIGSQNPKTDMQSNCYAALKELEYYTTKGMLTTLKEKRGKNFFTDFGDGDDGYKPFEARYPVKGELDIVSELPPVDNCYFFGAVNAEEKSFNRDSLERQVARRIFYELMPGVGDTMRAKRIDIEGKNAFYSPDRLQNRAKSFFATGLSVIEFPAPRIMNALASGLAAYCCHFALFPNARGFPDLKTDVEKFSREIGLNEIKLKRELEKQDTGTVTDSIKNDKDEWNRIINDRIKVKTFDKDSIAQEVIKVQAEAIDRIREGVDSKSSGVYVQTISNNGARIWHDIEAKIENSISGYVGEKEKGPEHTQGFLSLLLDMLSNEQNTYSKMKLEHQRRLEDAKRKVDWRIKRLKDDLSDKYRWELKKHTQWLCDKDLTVFMNTGKEKIICGAANDLIHKTKDKLEILRTQADKYSADLKKWKKKYIVKMFEELKNLNEQLEENPVNLGLIKIIQGLPNDAAKWENDFVGIYNTFLASLFRTYTIANPISDLDEVAEKILKKTCQGTLGKALFEAVFSNFKAFREKIFAACRENFKDIKNVNICDLLLQIDGAARRDILNKKKKEAGWLLKVQTHDETIDHVPNLFEKKWVGVSEKININSHDIWKDISEYDEDESRFKSLKEPYRMLFAGEMGVFCLRNVNLLKDYKAAFNAYLGECHTNKQIIFPDIMPPGPRLKDIHLRSEMAALIGKIMGFLKEETDPVNNYPAIYLYYSDRNTKTRKNERLCSKWNEVEQTLRELQAKKEIEKKIGDITPLDNLDAEIHNKAKNANTKDEKEDLRRIMDNYCQEKLNELNDEKHPFYQKELKIIDVFCKEHNIPAMLGKRS